jgi:hypothetical protein
MSILHCFHSGLKALHVCVVFVITHMNQAVVSDKSDTLSVNYDHCKFQVHLTTLFSWYIQLLTSSDRSLYFKRKYSVQQHNKVQLLKNITITHWISKQRSKLLTWNHTWDWSKKTHPDLNQPLSSIFHSTKHHNIQLSNSRNSFWIHHAWYFFLTLNINGSYNHSNQTYRREHIYHQAYQFVVPKATFVRSLAELRHRPQ